MKIIVGTAVIFFFLIAPLALKAQFGYDNLSTKSKKAIEYYSNGDQYYVRRDYYSAIEWFEKAIKKDDKFIEAWFRIGSSHYNLGDLPKSEEFWTKAYMVSEGGNTNAYIKFFLGKVQFEMGDYENSKSSLNKYLEDSTPNEKNRSRAQNYLENANFATESIEMNLDFNPRPLDETVNTFPLQYFPVMPVGS